MVVVLVHHDHIKKKKLNGSKKQEGAHPYLMVSLGGAIYFPAI